MIGACCYLLTSSPFSGKTLFLIGVKQSISSLSNPKVKELVRLRQSARKRREQGLFVVEGIDEVEAFLKTGKPVREIYCGTAFARGSAGGEFLEEWKDTCPVFELEPDVFAKASYANGSDGLIAIAQTWELGLPAISEKPRVVVVLDEVEKPGNLGAILRTAEAFGVSFVLLSDPVLDFFNPNVVRSSRGLMAGVRVGCGTKEEVAAWLQAQGMEALGTSSKGKRPLWEMAFRHGTAFVLGSEKAGLGKFWKERIEQWVRIPMKGEASSLNLNVSTACLVAEFNRQIG